MDQDEPMEESSLADPIIYIKDFSKNFSQEQ